MSSADDIKDFMLCYNCSGLFDRNNVYTLTHQSSVLTFCSLLCLIQYAMTELADALKNLSASAHILAEGKQ